MFPNAQTWLGVWERGLQATPLQRALLILQALTPEASWHELCRLPLGERDARLLVAREALFGPRLEALARCPACGEALELSLRVADLRLGQGPTRQTLEHGHHRLTLRPLDSLDLAAALTSPDPAHTLTLRAVEEASHQGRNVEAAQLPPGVLDAAAQRLPETDPQADLLLQLSCPDCRHAWAAPFDTVAFVWCELNAWALRTLTEVHRLASAYGWREGDILALSPTRRQFYLGMVGA
jgi:hypothetical protein